VRKEVGRITERHEKNRKENVKEIGGGKRKVNI